MSHRTPAHSHELEAAVHKAVDERLAAALPNGLAAAVHEAVDARVAALSPDLEARVQKAVDARVAALSPDLEARVQKAVDERLAAAVEARLGPLQAALDDISARLAGHDAAAGRVSLLVFSGDLDRLLAGFIIATSAAAMGLQVSMYFTFWGLVALKKRTIYAGKSLPEMLLAAFTPSTPAGAGTSKLHMLGAGPVMLKSIMKAKGVESLPGLIDVARSLGVRLIACQMSMDVMGVVPDELIEGLEFAGAAAYVGEAGDARVTLMI